MDSTQVAKPTVSKSVKTKKVTFAKMHVHPKFSEMISEAIKELKSRTGCSRLAILKFIREKYDIGEKQATTNLKLALKRGIENGTLKMARMEGKNSHKFKLVDNGTVKKPKKVNLEAKEKKSINKVAKSVLKGKTAAVKKVVKVNKGKGRDDKKSTTKKPTSKSAKTSKVNSGVKGSKKVLRKTSKM